MPDLVYYRHLPSPIGKLLLTSDGDAVTGLHMSTFAGQPAPEPDAAWKQDDRVFVRVCEQLEAYFEGERVQFDVPIVLDGTAFQKRVWEKLSAIPYGVAISYLELARQVGSPKGSRAVGGANGRNPVAIIVPCHRVIAADGNLGGYGGGLDRKRWLLEHEAEVLARHPEWRSAVASGSVTPRLLRA